jgi:hypothetical protein
MAELLPEVEEYLSLSTPESRAITEPLFLQRGPQAQREMLAGMQMMDSEFQMDIQERMPYRAPPIDPSRFRFQDTEPGSYRLRGAYMPRGLAVYDRLPPMLYEEDGVTKSRRFPEEPDTVNVYGAAQADLPTISHEYRHRMDNIRGENRKPFKVDRETLVRFQDLMTSGNLQEVKDQMESLTDYIFVQRPYVGSEADLTGRSQFKKKIQNVFDAEEQAQRDAGETGLVLRNKRAKNPEAIQSLVEELKMASPTYTFRSGKKTKTDPPIAGVLEYLATLEQKERAAAEEENRPLGDTLLLSDLKKSQAYKDVMGIKEPYRFEDGTYMEEPSILQRVGEGIESLTGGRTLPEIIDQELIERAKNVMQGAPEEKAMGGPVGGLDVYFNQMRRM